MSLFQSTTPPPQLSPHLLQNLSDLLKQLETLGLTLTPLPSKSPDPSIPTSLHDYISPITTFTGSFATDGLTIDEWRIRMRMKLSQMNQIESLQGSDAFKANWVLSMLSGEAFRVVKGRFVEQVRGSNPCAGYPSVKAMLEAVCDEIRDHFEGGRGEKMGGLGLGGGFD